MVSFDSASKRVVQQHPRDFVAFAFNLRGIRPDEFTHVELITPELPAVDMRQADVLLKVNLRGTDVLVHFEIQTTDSFDPPMALRMAGYIIRLIEKYRMDVYSHVIYLRPNAGLRDPGYFAQAIAAQRVLVEYEVIRLAEVEGQAILDAELPGLLPFTPLMRRPADVSADAWLQQCIEAVDSLSVPHKLDLLGSLAALASAIYDIATISEMIRRLTMEAIPIVEYWGAQAIRDTRREDILKVLEARLHPEVAGAFKPALEAIENVQRLDELVRAAALADSVADFQKVLDATSNGTGNGAAGQS